MDNDDPFSAHNAHLSHIKSKLARTQVASNPSVVASIKDKVTEQTLQRKMQHAHLKKKN